MLPSGYLFRALDALRPTEFAKDAVLPRDDAARVKEHWCKVEKKRKERKGKRKKRTVLDGTIGYSRRRTAGRRGIDVIEKRTAKERVHMYAGDVGT